MKPIVEDKSHATLSDLPRMLKKLPRLDDELDDFAADLEEILRELKVSKLNN